MCARGVCVCPGGGLSPSQEHLDDRGERALPRAIHGAELVPADMDG